MKLGLLSFLILFPVLLFGQKMVSLNIIAGNYAMKDLKSMQTQFEQNFSGDYALSGIQVERVLDFPVSLQGELGIDWVNKERRYGAFFNYTETKGKSHYRDYSGEIFAEQKVSRILAGLKFSQNLVKGFRFYGKLGVSQNSLAMISAIHLTGVVPKEEELYFNAWGLSLEPGLCWEYSFQNLVFNIAGGYEISEQGKTYKKDSEDELLLNRNREEVRLHWNGFRLGLGVGYVF